MNDYDVRKLVNHLDNYDFVKQNVECTEVYHDDDNETVTLYFSVPTGNIKNPITSMSIEYKDDDQWNPYYASVSFLDYDDQKWVDVFLRKDIIDNLTRLYFENTKTEDLEEDAELDEH